MAVGKSIKMYLTIFLATTCIYMVLYQYHISVQPLSTATDIIKKKENLPEAENSQRSDRILISSLTTSAPVLSSSSLASSSSLQTSSPILSRYNIFLWSPLTFLTKSKSLRYAYRISKNDTEKIRGHDKKLTRLKENSTIPVDNSNNLNANDEDQDQDVRISISPTRSPWMALLSKKSHKSDKENAVLLIDTTTTTTGATASPTTIISTTTTTTSTTSDLKMNSMENDLQPLGLAAPIMEAQHDNANYRYKASSSPSSSSSSIIKSFASSVIKVDSSANRTANTTISRKDTITNQRTSTANRNPVKRTSTKLFINSFMTETKPPPLYIITPTYRRAEQLAELTRLGYTLKHIVNLLWLVIEDANTTSALVAKTLDRIGVPYEYLIAPMPEEYKKTKKAKPRGVSNRNRGLAWLRQNATEGVFYFADDDNTYDISIFEQMRYTRKVSMWPVGLVTKLGVSSPIIRNGKIVGFYDGWIGGRKYPVDMAGFAVSVKFLHERPDAKMPFKPGYEEDGFLKSLSPLQNSEIELLASNCTEILTWHTQTKKNGPAEPLNQTKYGDTNLVSIDKMLVRP